MQPLTREQVREVDRLAIEELGIPGVVLMENAGRNAVGAIMQFCRGGKGAPQSAHLYCGGGNNGGDGYVIARHMHNLGVAVTIFAHKPVEALTGDAAVNAKVCREMGLDILPTEVLDASAAPPGVVIDALLGTGFRGALREDMLGVIRHINAQRDRPDAPTVVAIDIPSGLDCDTGRPPESGSDSDKGDQHNAVVADLTVTFVAPKLGFSQPAAWPYIGKVEVVDIGAPPKLVRRVCN